MKQIPQFRPADRRLIRGYGPLLVVVAVFLMITVTVPTVAPQQTVALPVSGQAPVPGAVPGADGAATPGGIPAAPGGQGQQAPGGAPSIPGGPVSVPQGTDVKKCEGPQVDGDPYSPACITFSGSNGGATTRGVTVKDIVITYMNPTDGSKSQNESVAAAIGGYNDAIRPETYDQMLTTLQNLVTYFNEHFQFYGRKIVLKVFNGQQDYAGSNQSQVNADALQVANSLGGFAEINVLNLKYAEALARQRVVNFGNLYASDEFYRALAPFSWTTGADCTQMATDLGNLAVKGLAGRPATWAGGGVDTDGNRRFAVIAPDLPSYQQCADTLVTTMKRGGVSPTTEIAYPYEASQASSIAQNMTQRIINDEVTSLLCLCDPLSQLLISNNLANSDYLPEFFDAGIAGLESDVFGQQMNQTAWAHASVLTSQTVIAGKYGSTQGYFAAKSVDPDAFIVNEVDLLYLRLYELALGIQLAGPNLTPETFAQGLFSYPGADGPYGPLSWTVAGSSYYSPSHEFRLQWWDPTARSAYDGETGSWQVLPAWLTSSRLPSAQPALFPNGTK